MSDVIVNPIRSVVISQSVSGLPPSPTTIYYNKVAMLENAGAFGVMWNQRKRANQVSVPGQNSNPAVGSAGSAGNSGSDASGAPALSANVGGPQGPSLPVLGTQLNPILRIALPAAAIVLMLSGNNVAALVTGAGAAYVWLGGPGGPLVPPPVRRT